MKTQLILHFFKILIALNLALVTSVNASNDMVEDSFLLENEKWNEVEIRDTLKQNRALRLSFQALGPNHILTNPKDGPRISMVGKWGLGYGIEYHFNERNALSLAYIATRGYIVSTRYRKENYEVNLADDYALTHFHKKHNFELGYGIRFGRQSWSKKTTFSTFDSLIEYGHSHSLGIITTAKYRIWRFVFASFNYSPSFYETSPNLGDFRYHHTISIGLIGTYRIFKKRIN